MIQGFVWRGEQLSDGRKSILFGSLFEKANNSGILCSVLLEAANISEATVASLV